MRALAKIGVAIMTAGILLAAFLFWNPFRGKGSPPAASINVGKTETHSTMAASSSSSSPEGACFSSRSVLLVMDNTHPLTERVSKLVFDDLKKGGTFEKVDRADGVLVAEGDRSPDLFIRLGLVDLKFGGVVPRTCQVRFAADLSTLPWQSTYFVQDSSTPPVANFKWDATLSIDSRFTGVQTDPYGPLAKEIAESLSKAISKEVHTLSGKYPALPELPAAFYGPYEPIADFPFLRDLKARPICSYHSLLVHNQTFWKFQTAPDPAPQLESTIGKAEALGWKVYYRDLAQQGGGVLRLTKGNTDLTIFAESMGMGLNDSSSGTKSTNFIAHYRQPFSLSEREAACEALFQQGADVDIILPFERSFSAAQRKRFFELLGTSPVLSPLACARAAGFYLDGGNTNSALKMLVRAKALSALYDQESSREATEAVASKISKDLKPVVSTDVCRELQFLELDDAANFKVSRPLGRPLGMFAAGDRGVEILGLNVQPARGGYFPYAFTRSSEGSRSKGTGSFPTNAPFHYTFQRDSQEFTVTGKVTSDQKLIEYVVRAAKKQ